MTEIASKYVGLKTWGWYLNDLENWKMLFSRAGASRLLEIGAFDGVSGNLMLDVLFPDERSELHCIDAFLPDPTTPEVDGETKQKFEENALRGGHANQIRLYEGLSVEVLAWMIANEGYWESFDFIYVDGSHLARNVLMDATLSWNLLKTGGIVIFDDYQWGNPNDRYGRPKLAIDAFANVFGNRIEEVLGGYRKGYRKIAA